MVEIRTIKMVIMDMIGIFIFLRRQKLIFFVTKDEEIVPVTKAINPIPDIIIIIANNRPGKLDGAISPYPTVVMVTIVHHNEFTILLKLVCNLLSK